MWEIKRDELVPKLQDLEVVPEKLGIPASEYFWIRGKGRKIKLSLASYISGQITLVGKGKWPSKKDLFIDRRILAPFIYAAKELKDKHTFEFTCEGDSLIVTHGSRAVRLDSQTKVTGYGNLSKILRENATTLPATEDLKELLLCGKNCAVSDAVVPHLNCCYVTKNGSNLGVQAYAASDKVFYFGTGDVAKEIKSDTPFPLFLIGLLSSPRLKRISWVGKFIVMQFKGGAYIWQPISQEALTEFPLKKIRKYVKIADKLPVTFTTSSRRFSRLMVRLGYYLQSVRRKDWVVKIRGKRGRTYLTITSNIPGVRVGEKIPTTEKVASSFEMEWPLDILEPIFEFLSKKTKKLGVVVRMDDKHGISYIRTGQYWLAVPGRQEK